LIREVSLANPLWRALRIHGELLKLGIEVAQTTVAKYMAQGRPPTFAILEGIPPKPRLGHCVDRFSTATCKLLFGLLIIRHERRRLAHVAVTGHPTAAWVARQISEAFPWDTAPTYLIRDRDSVYGQVFRRRPGAIGIRDRPTAPQSPWQNASVERLIESVRKECLDHLIVFGEPHLRRVLIAYADYYIHTRTHLSLNKDAPSERPVLRKGRIESIPHLGGLHHSYIRT